MFPSASVLHAGRSPSPSKTSLHKRRRRRRAQRRNFTSLRAEYVLDFALIFALDFCHAGPLILPRGTLKQASDVGTFESNWFTQRCTDSKTKFTMSRLSAATTVCLL